MNIKLYKVIEEVEMNNYVLIGTKHSIMEDTMKLYSKMKKEVKDLLQYMLHMNMADVWERVEEHQDWLG